MVNAAVPEIVQFLCRAGALYLFVLIIGHVLMLPLAIMLHELGHLLAAKFEKIPVIQYQIGSGREFLGFYFLGLRWSFNTNLLTGGAVHIPRLIPTTDKNWRSIVWIVLAGPFANLVFTIVFTILAAIANTFIMQALLFSLAYANWLLIRNAKNDYLMAQTAHRKDSASMAGFYIEGVYEYRMV